MRRAATAVFATLALATFAAFFVAARLKAAPVVISEFGRTPRFSPNQDGRFEGADVRFELLREDRVTLAVVDAAGDEVRELIGGRDFPRDAEVRARWDGRDDAGTRVRDGVYRYRITLQRQGRNVVLPQSVQLDTTPPRPRVLSIGPQRSFRPQPELLPEPGGQPAQVRLFAPGGQVRVLLFRTAPGAPRLVLAEALPDGTTTWRWDGRTRSGRPAARGTYLVALESRDRVGNIGTTPALDDAGLPAVPYGGSVPGRPGITVRRLGVQPPLVAAAAGATVDFAVDARGRPWTWRLRRLGSPDVQRRGRKTTARLRLHAPGRESGVYLLDVRTAGHRAQVPFAVHGRTRRSVLVVLPAITWQARNPVDDDGDGLADVLDRGVAARLGRVFAAAPEGFLRREGPLMAWLQSTGRRFDVTTDLALARGQGPPLGGREAVVLAGDARWLPRPLLERLRAFARRGGRVLDLGIDSLRRQVRVTPRRLADPTSPAPVDVFGIGPAALERSAVPVALTAADDQIDLFAGTAGELDGWHALQPVARLQGARQVASAVTEDGRTVILAARLGRGLVFRTGLPELPARLGVDGPTTALMERMWTLLSR